MRSNVALPIPQLHHPSRSFSHTHPSKTGTFLAKGETKKKWKPTSAVRYSRMAAEYTAAVAPTRPWLVVRFFRCRWILPTGNYKQNNNKKITVIERCPQIGAKNFPPKSTEKISPVVQRAPSGKLLWLSPFRNPCQLFLQPAWKIDKNE